MSNNLLKNYTNSIATQRLLEYSILSILTKHLLHYPTALNLTYAWSFGSVAGLFLVFQIITGIFLTMHYTPYIDLAFSSVEHIMRDVNNGWTIRYIHANGASFFFILVYLHMFRGLYFGSYMKPRQYLWKSGVLIFILMMATAFMGYVLPWGQMSFWGATVITNLFSAIPAVGDSITQWLWGGYSVDNATLNRFFSLHYLMPFLIVVVVILHLVLLHQDGSNNPLGISSNTNKIDFYPYFYVKDLFSLLVVLTFFSIVLFYFPNAMGHPDNYIPADSLVTPPHIVPEWYFLPFYAILRAIPDKLGGVFAMGLAIVVLFFVPYLNFSKIYSSRFRPLYRIGFWFFFVNSMILGWIGQKIVEYPYAEIAQLSTLSYFGYFLLILPILSKIENSVNIKNLKNK